MILPSGILFTFSSTCKLGTLWHRAWMPVPLLNRLSCIVHEFVQSISNCWVTWADISLQWMSWLNSTRFDFKKKKVASQLLFQGKEWIIVSHSPSSWYLQKHVHLFISHHQSSFYQPKLALSLCLTDCFPHMHEFAFISTKFYVMLYCPVMKSFWSSLKIWFSLPCVILYQQ